MINFPASARKPDNYFICKHGRMEWLTIDSAIPTKHWIIRWQVKILKYHIPPPVENGNFFYFSDKWMGAYKKTIIGIKKLSDRRNFIKQVFKQSFGK